MTVEINKNAEGSTSEGTNSPKMPFGITDTPTSTGSTGTQATPSDAKPEKKEAEYLLCSDTTSEVIESGTGAEGLSKCRKMMGQIRKCGGQVTIFKSLEF